jgi:hypothetical protein
MAVRTEGRVKDQSFMAVRRILFYSEAEAVPIVGNHRSMWETSGGTYNMYLPNIERLLMAESVKISEKR